MTSKLKPIIAKPNQRLTNTKKNMGSGNRVHSIMHNLIQLLKPIEIFVLSRV